jgi:hypothetical protein
MIHGFEGVRVRRVFAGQCSDSNDAFEGFAIGEAGELFSWGFGSDKCLGRTDRQDQSSSKRVEALRGVRVSCVSSGSQHALALAEDGQVCAWGVNNQQYYPHVTSSLEPQPVEALRGVRVGSIAAGGHRSYVVTDTAMANGQTASCPSRLSCCAASRWMQCPPAPITRWRWRTMEVSTRGATMMRYIRVRSALALQ